MTQPVLFKQSFLIAVLAGVQAVMPAVVAVASLYATITFFGIVFDRSSQAIIIVAVLCLILVQPPREVSTQLTAGSCCLRSCWRSATSPSLSLNIRVEYF
jgi:hypothetical protein